MQKEACDDDMANIRELNDEILFLMIKRKILLVLIWNQMKTKFQTCMMGKNDN